MRLIDEANEGKNEGGSSQRLLPGNTVCWSDY